MTGLVKTAIAAVAATLIAVNVWAGTMLPPSGAPGAISATYGD